MGSFTVGLDLGQSQDYSALVVVERVLVLPLGVKLVDYHRSPASLQGAELVEEFHVRAIKRWALGTSYPAVVVDVERVMCSQALRRDAVLFVDRSGIGRAVFDLLNDAFHARRLGAHPPIPVTITSGQHAQGWSVPKVDLIDGLLVPLTQGRVRVSDELGLGEALQSELLAFSQKISDAGRTSYDFERRAGQGHGDIATALMLALVRENTMRRPALIENPSTGITGWADYVRGGRP